jgi:Mn-dependent DtxR family transcriptional regulator
MHESGEMYLETIFMLSKEKTNVRSIDIARKMNFSRPSVCRAMRLLKDGGFIDIDENGFIILTETGLEYAEKIYERHTVLTELLISFGIDEKTASEDACRMEHVISDKSVNKIKNTLCKN